MPNPYHDEHGQFTDAAGAVAGQANGPAGAEFEHPHPDVRSRDARGTGADHRSFAQHERRFRESRVHISPTEQRASHELTAAHGGVERMAQESGYRYSGSASRLAQKASMNAQLEHEKRAADAVSKIKDNLRRAEHEKELTYLVRARQQIAATAGVSKK